MSELFDDDVKIMASDKLLKVLREAESSGQSPDMVAELLLDGETDKTSDKLIEELKDFADARDRFVRTTASKVNRITEEVKRRLSSFISRGRTDYQYARNVEDFMEVHRSHSRILQAGLNEADTAVRYSVNVLRSTNAEEERLRKRLAGAI